jgi:SAM-dependent methyltransferase
VNNAPNGKNVMKCRHCTAEVSQRFVDLGASPPSNAYLTARALGSIEQYFPLRVLVCTRCWLVQTEDFAEAAELFNSEYAYFSSVSHSWLRHAADYAAMITSVLRLNAESLVIEIAANDGYLLKNFVASGIPCLGIEPTASTAIAAEKLGVPIIREFFGTMLGDKLSREGRQADLVIANNVLAHVPDVNDFAAGLKRVLKPGGVITFEFPHLMRLIEHAQFDTIYHEHFSYLSLYVVKTILSSVDIRIWDVEELSTHGGSLRVYACHAGDPRETSSRVRQTLDAEQAFGLLDASTYEGFQHRADQVKDDLVSFLIETKRAGKTVAAYGAAAKGNTLLNYGGIKSDLLPYVCDANPSKQGKYLPGSRLPILHPDALMKQKPDYIIILPWNIAAEVIGDLSAARDWGARFIIAVPKLQEVG